MRLKPCVCAGKVARVVVWEWVSLSGHLGCFWQVCPPFCTVWVIGNECGGREGGRKFWEMASHLMF